MKNALKFFSYRISQIRILNGEHGEQLLSLILTWNS